MIDANSFAITITDFFRIGNMKRMTKQRKAILNCLLETGRPLYIEEILEYAASKIPRINLSTVYRTIKALMEEEKIILSELPGEKSYYEIIQKDHHHYFVCDACSKVYFITQCPKGVDEIVPEGFHLLGHSITLNGFCVECHS